MKAVIANNLTKKYGKSFNLDGLNLQVEEGDYLGLVGLNGVGKTTLLRLLSGLLKPTDGEGYIFGHSVRNVKKLSHLIGVVHQTTRLPDSLTVKEYLETEGKLRGVKQDSIYDAISTAKLDKLMDRQIGKLSIGSKRKLSIVKALMHKPRVLMLDEPSVGLDPLARRWIWDYLKNQQKTNITCLLSTHYLEEVEYLCNKALLLRNNKGFVESSMIDLHATPAIHDITLSFKEISDNSLTHLIQIAERDGRKVQYDKRSLIIEMEEDPFTIIPDILTELIRLKIRFQGVFVNNKSIEDVLVDYCAHN